MTGESALERRCVKMARDAGGELIKLHPWTVRGLPDRLLVMPDGVVAFVELKAPEGRLTPLQEWWRDRLVELGHRHLVIDDIEQFEAVL